MRLLNIFKQKSPHRRAWLKQKDGTYLRTYAMIDKERDAAIKYGYNHKLYTSLTDEALSAIYKPHIEKEISYYDYVVDENV